MPDKSRLRILLPILTASILLMVYQGYKGEMNPLGFISHPINRINEALTKAALAVSATFNGLTLNYGEMQDLRKEIDKLRLENSRLMETELQNARLTELLALKGRTPNYLTAARVISKGNDPWAKTVVIDKGSSDLLSNGMAVITPNGLAGKVHRVYGSYSSVLLIDDKRFRAAARLQAGRTEGVYAGTGSSHSALEYVESKQPVTEGEVVVTSGLDNMFPQGINIGYVSKASKTDKRLFQEIDIIPFVDTKSLEEVIVLR
ncbi:MAG: rod shape-determining protein MreC [Thermodesulfovibrionales bacterium]|nr:rod shape-determining protein MreC [Thermodesulfovibrionales bacterium]